MVLNQKLNDQIDTEQEQNNTKKKNRELILANKMQATEIQSLKSEISSKDSRIRTNEQLIEDLNNKFKMLTDEFEEMQESKEAVKKDNTELNQKIVQLE